MRPGNTTRCRVDAVAELRQHLLPPGAFRRRHAVADAVATDHHHPNVLACTQQVRHRPHHHMEAAIRLQVARHVGDQLLVRPDDGIADPEIAPPHLRIGLAYIEIDAFRQQRDGSPRPVRIGRELPSGRRLPMRAEVERQQVDRILRPDARVVRGMRREFRIEPDIDAVDAIVEFQIAEQRRVGPDVADVEQFAPAVVADDDVRLEAELLQIGRVCATISARRTAASSSRAATCASAAAPFGFAYGTVRTPGIRLAFGSVMNTTSCCLDATRWRTRCRYWPGKFWWTNRYFTDRGWTVWVSAICELAPVGLDLRVAGFVSASAGCVSPAQPAGSLVLRATRVPQPRRRGGG